MYLMLIVNDINRIAFAQKLVIRLEHRLNVILLFDSRVLCLLQSNCVWQLDDEVLELDELLRLLLGDEVGYLIGRLLLIIASCCGALLLYWCFIGSLGLPHLLDTVPVVIDDVALVSQIGIQEPSEDHDL